MNIETNIKDVIVSPPDSNGSKRSFGSDDSLEYSNDDRSVANGGKGKGAGELDKPKDNLLPPKYPPSFITTFEQPDTSMFTPQRKQPANMERLPGPLNLFSPGLSPIGHANNSQYEHEEMVEVDNGIKTRLEDVAFATYDANMRDSMDSLEMTSPYFNKEVREKPDEMRPNYQFWRNKLFFNDHTGDAAVGNESNAAVVEEQSLISAAPDTPQHQKSFIRSNSNSFDSDFNLTPRHSLVYPTTDALYERSVALSPKSADVSMDSDLHVTKQSLVYPTTTALYERSTHHSTNASVNEKDTYIAHQSFVYPAVGFPSERDSPGHRGVGGAHSADVSIDSDAHVAHQSLVYPTTAALYERTVPRSANASFDSELHLTKQSLVYPSSAALRYQRAGHPSADDGLESDISLLQQSYWRQPKEASVGRGSVSMELSKLSMIDRDSAGEAEDRRYDEDALGQSLHSISLLPDSPISSSPAPQQRTSHFMFPPPRPNGISPSNLRNPVGEMNADKAASPPTLSNAPQQPRRNGLQMQMSSSDTEYAKSASKRRQAEHQTRQGGQLWKEAEDVAPSGVFSAAPTPTSALTTSMKSGWRTAETIAGDANTPHDDRSGVGVDDDLSVSPPGPPSPSSVSAGSPSIRGAHDQHHHHQQQHNHQYHAQGAPSSSSLVVGGLYTLQVDSQGSPAFVPVLLDPHATSAAAGITLSSPNGGEGLPTTTHGRSGHGHHRAPAPAPAALAVAHHQYSSPPPRKSFFDFRAPSGRTDELDLTGPNSNHVDVEKVLDRALHCGSLSEEKVNKRWGGDTNKRNSPPVALSHAGDRGLPPITPQRGAHRTASSSGHSVPGSSVKSPFRLSMGADGKEHLQLSAGYFKERLLLRSLTSVLNTP